MLGWVKHAESLASSRNMRTSVGLSARSGRIRLITSRFWKPIAPSRKPRNTSPMPPSASFRTRVYLPKVTSWPLNPEFCDDSDTRRPTPTRIHHGFYTKVQRPPLCPTRQGPRSYSFTGIYLCEQVSKHLREGP